MLLQRSLLLGIFIITTGCASTTKILDDTSLVPDSNVRITWERGGFIWGRGSAIYIFDMGKDALHNGVTRINYSGVYAGPDKGKESAWGENPVIGRYSKQCGTTLSDVTTSLLSKNVVNISNLSSNIVRNIDDFVRLKGRFEQKCLEEYGELDFYKAIISEKGYRYAKNPVFIYSEIFLPDTGTIKFPDMPYLTDNLGRNYFAFEKSTSYYLPVAIIAAAGGTSDLTWIRPPGEMALLVTLCLASCNGDLGQDRKSLNATLLPGRHYLVKYTYGEEMTIREIGNK